MGFLEYILCGILVSVVSIFFFFGKQEVIIEPAGFSVLACFFVMIWPAVLVFMFFYGIIQVSKYFPNKNQSPK